MTATMQNWKDCSTPCKAPRLHSAQYGKGAACARSAAPNASTLFEKPRQIQPVAPDEIVDSLDSAESRGERRATARSPDDAIHRAPPPWSQPATRQQMA
eukprot:2918468-Pyramimonas_sp.AAC.2